MRESLLGWARCPTCEGPLSLAAEAARASRAMGLPPEVREGTLRCGGCGSEYPVVDFVPDLRPADSRQQVHTDRHYSAWWARHLTDRRGERAGAASTTRAEYASHAEVVSRVLPLTVAPGQRLLDAGCGEGSDLEWLARQFPAAEVIGLDLSEGVFTTLRRTAALPNVHVVRGSVLQPPLERRSVDLVYSYGVIHHTPQPRAAFAALAARVARSGRVVIYVYTDLREEPLLRLALAPVTLLRSATRRLGPRALGYLSLVLAVPIFLAFGLPAMALRAAGQEGRAQRLPFNWLRSPLAAQGDLYDRLGAEYERRYNPAELRHWFAEVGFTSVAVRKLPDRRGWLAHGEAG